LCERREADPPNFPRTSPRTNAKRGTPSPKIHIKIHHGSKTTPTTTHQSPSPIALSHCSRASPSISGSHMTTTTTTATKPPGKISPSIRPTHLSSGLEPWATLNKRRLIHTSRSAVLALLEVQPPSPQKNTDKPFDQSSSMASYIPTTACFGCRKISSHTKNHFAYGPLPQEPVHKDCADQVETPTDPAERRKWYGYGRKRGEPPYADQYPRFQRPPDETTIVFDMIDHWNVRKIGFMDPVRYPTPGYVQHTEVTMRQLAAWRGQRLAPRTRIVAVQTDDEPPPPYEP
jgi:hypothetical protein